MTCTLGLERGGHGHEPAERGVVPSPARPQAPSGRDRERGLCPELWGPRARLLQDNASAAPQLLSVLYRVSQAGTSVPCQAGSRLWS